MAKRLGPRMNVVAKIIPTEMPARITQAMMRAIHISFDVLSFMRYLYYFVIVVKLTIRSNHPKIRGT
jgi:hypothetical protein